MRERTKKYREREERERRAKPREREKKIKRESERARTHPIADDFQKFPRRRNPPASASAREAGEESAGRDTGFYGRDRHTGEGKGC